MKKRAFVRQIILYLAALVLLLTVVLVVYAASSYSILRSEIEQSAENFLQVYGGELKSRVQQMDRVLQNLLVQNYSELQIIRSAEESKRVYASLSIKSYITDLLRSDDTVGSIVVADGFYQQHRAQGAAYGADLVVQHDETLAVYPHCDLSLEIRRGQLDYLYGEHFRHRQGHL